MDSSLRRFSFPPANGGVAVTFRCSFCRPLTIVSFETSSARLMSSQRYSALAAWSPLPRQNGSLPHRR
jgi:hypothetical protein